MSKHSEGKLLYHITHINNMESILSHGLMSRSEIVKRKMVFNDIADHEILAKREDKNRLSNYVLFHFFAKNPFDCAVCNKHGSENMVIITIRRNFAKDNAFLIIPSHPLDSSEPKIYKYDEGYKLVRWDILDSDERKYSDDITRKACMAECLTKDIVAPEDFLFIYVPTDEVKKQICDMKKATAANITVNRNMFIR